MSLEDWVWIRNFLLALLFPFANKGFRGCVVANGNEFDMEKKWNKIRIFMSDGSNTSLESLNIHLDKVIYTKSQMILEGKRRQSCVWQARKTHRITSWYLYAEVTKHRKEYLLQKYEYLCDATKTFLSKWWWVVVEIETSSFPPAFSVRSFPSLFIIKGIKMTNFPQ